MDFFSFGYKDWTRFFSTKRDYIIKAREKAWTEVVNGF